MAVLNQRQRVEFFPWQAVNQQNAPLNQRKIAEVGSGKPSNGAGWRAVNQLNQLNQHYFCLLSEKKQRLTEREVSMTAQISAYGRLVADPETRTTGKGTSMAMARLAVSLPCNAAADGQATFWLGVSQRERLRNRILQDSPGGIYPAYAVSGGAGRWR